jgi:hypothetical protein
MAAKRQRCTNSINGTTKKPSRKPVVLEIIIFSDGRLGSTYLFENLVFLQHNTISSKEPG